MGAFATCRPMIGGARSVLARAGPEASKWAIIADGTSPCGVGLAFAFIHATHSSFDTKSAAALSLTGNSLTSPNPVILPVVKFTVAEIHISLGDPSEVARSEPSAWFLTLGALLLTAPGSVRGVPSSVSPPSMVNSLKSNPS